MFTILTIDDEENINTNKMKFSTTEPNTVNMTLGFRGTIKNDSTENYATRCITWTSVGYFDEEVLFRKIETERETGWSHAESFNEETTVYEFAPEHIVNNYKDLLIPFEFILKFELLVKIFEHVPSESCLHID